ncbi:MAG TPA: O-antigen ligase family protein [Flavisolibacter sp.]|nr:O-antigen ligase family protein [Flavisolibacter sp.]
MGISTDTSLRRELIFLSVLLMLAALFTSRFLLSVSLIAFVLACCAHKNFTKQLSTFLKNPFLIAISLLFFIPFITWFWSEDKMQWWRWTRIKLPLFLLPVCFAGNWQLSKRHWNAIAFSFLFLVTAGCCWSLWSYARNPEAVHEAYLKAKVIATPLRDDHVRYSLLVSEAVVCAFYMMRNEEKKKIKIVLGFVLAFFVVYLHILSARTGLVALYIFLFLLLVHLIVSLKNRQRTWMLAALILLMPVAAWFLLPTFQNRIRYLIYDFSFTRAGQYLPGANDGNRIRSLEAGWSIVKDHPFGVGSGDVWQATTEWYAVHIPGLVPSDLVYPSSEWLLYGAAAGWAGMIAFTLIMLLPFLVRKQDRVSWVSLNMMSAFSLLFDVGLETQFGVFIYAFLLLWWWKWQKAQGDASVLGR